MILRKALELASRNRSFWRRIPAEFEQRPLCVSPDAALRWYRPNPFDLSLHSVAQRVGQGEVVWDLGANVGEFALAAGVRSRATVVAVECDDFLAHLLRRTAAANADLDIRVEEIAVSDQAARERFSVSSRGRAANGLPRGPLSTQHAGSRTERWVQTTTLDAMLEVHPAPEVVKIDVEGAELLALQGAEHLLDGSRPRLFIEVARTNMEPIAALLDRHNYRWGTDYGGDLWAEPRSRSSHQAA